MIRAEPASAACSACGEKTTALLVSEEIGGVPLGLSRDYDLLPLTEPLRLVRCQICDGLHEDAMRLMADGCRVLAIMCRGCREQGRARWIAEHPVELPAAIARYRS